MKTKVMYGVYQYQPNSDYDGELFYRYDTEEDAIKAARNLNKTYGDNCIFSMEGDYEETVNDNEYHYYTVEPLSACENTKVDKIPEQDEYFDHFIIQVDWSSYVGKDDTMVENIDDAKTFNTWDEARSLIKVLESLDIYENEGPLYIKGIGIK